MIPLAAYWQTSTPPKNPILRPNEGKAYMMIQKDDLGMTAVHFHFVTLHVLRILKTWTASGRGLHLIY